MGFSDGPTGTRVRPDAGGHPLLRWPGWKWTREAALGQHLLARVPLGAPDGHVFLELALKMNREFSGTGHRRVQGQTVFRNNWTHTLESLSWASSHVWLLVPFSGSSDVVQTAAEMVALNPAWPWLVLHHSVVMLPGLVLGGPVGRRGRWALAVAFQAGLAPSSPD